MKLFFFIPALLSCVLSFSQVYDPEHVKAKAVTLYEKALDLLKDGELKEGVPLLMQSIKEDSNFVDAYLSLAGALGQLKRYDQSVKLYEKARSKDTTYFVLYNLPYSINLAGQGRFEEASKAVDAFMTYPKLNERSIKSAQYRKRCYEFAVRYASQHKDTHYDFAPVNLGDSVNTAQSEYYPSVTVTDSLLVFTRLGEHGREDFIESRINKKSFGQWKMIDGDINMETNKGALSVSQDGEWMVFAGELMGQGYRSFDIYISYYTPQGWSEP